MSAEVCVALPVKDGSAFLAQAIESVLAQAGVELELRVIDNRSADDSVAIARRYEHDPRVTVTVNETDLLYYGSLNRVLAATDADYFVPFACDDAMRPGNLAAKVAALRSTGALLAHSPAVWMDENGVAGDVVIDHSLTPPLAPAPSFFATLVPHNRIICPSAVVSCDALRALGGFDARDDFAADWLAWLRLSLRGAVATVAEPLVAYRAHGASGTSRVERLGLRGMYEPATLAAVLDDPAFPEAWESWRAALTLATGSFAAAEMHRTGARRAAAGWAAYWVQGRALAAAPGDRGGHDRYDGLVRAAGLTPPRRPWEAVTPLPDDAAQAAALAEVVQEIGPLLARLLVVAAPGREDEAMRRLAPHFADTALDVGIVVGDVAAAELAPGRIAIGPWAGDWIALAEAAGVPAWPSQAPDPFAVPADPDRWQTLPLAVAAR